ncbi:hypothetical protein M422DRAFT_240057 [Sphaerobolus stellatus SS14]|nr:hypothetical protein M422DRAFT_240057 [Sphaerobolus stellatus SS14]
MPLPHTSSITLSTPLFHKTIISLISDLAQLVLDTPSILTESSHSTSHERSITPESEEDNQEGGEESRQVKNARNPPWLAWQDRFLAAEVFKHQPFLATRRDAQKAWINLAQEMEKDSRLKGTVIKWSGPACHSRFKKILEGHKQNETRSLQKTGTNEDIDEHVWVMTDLMALIDGHDAAKEQKSAGAKAKASKEQQAALELCDAAMMGMRLRNTLSDIAQLDGATAHEKQGQRKCKQSQTSSGTDKENCAPSASKCVRNQTTIASVLQQREEEDVKQLEEARACDEQRHKQIIDGFDRMTQGLTTLNETIQYSMCRDSESNAQQTKVLKILSSVLQQRNNW